MLNISGFKKKFLPEENLHLELQRSQELQNQRNPNSFLWPHPSTPAAHNQPSLLRLGKRGRNPLVVERKHMLGLTEL
jgi:hypothetical protein